MNLDVVIVDDLEPLFLHPERFLNIRDDDLFRGKPLRRLNLRRDRFLHSIGNSSVFRFEIAAQSYILDAYVADLKGAARRYQILQQFQSAQLQEHGDLLYWPRGWCVSFKNDGVSHALVSRRSAPAVPPGAKLIVFADTPKMSDVLAGRRDKWYRPVGNVDWLHRAWARRA